MKNKRSNCPQSLILDIIGDKWTLLIIRDIILNNKRYFRDFLKSKEKIASNILADRLQKLEAESIIYKKEDPSHKQKIIYLLTEKGIDLFPILIENAKWSLKYKDIDSDDAMRLKEILFGGKERIEAIMDELRLNHISE
jgi:DNA-binding HxlR family transcriptional regulator